MTGNGNSKRREKRQRLPGDACRSFLPAPRPPQPIKVPRAGLFLQNTPTPQAGQASFYSRSGIFAGHGGCDKAYILPLLACRAPRRERLRLFPLHIHNPISLKLQQNSAGGPKRRSRPPNMPVPQAGRAISYARPGIFARVAHHHLSCGGTLRATRTMRNASAPPSSPKVSTGRSAASATDTVSKVSR